MHSISSQPCTPSPHSYALHLLTAMHSISSQPCTPSPHSHALHLLTATHSISSQPRTPSPHSHALHLLTATHSISSQPCTPSPHSHALHLLTAMHSISSQPCTPSPHSHALHLLTAMHSISSQPCTPSPHSHALHHCDNSRYCTLQRANHVVMNVCVCKIAAFAYSQNLQVPAPKGHCKLLHTLKSPKIQRHSFHIGQALERNKEIGGDGMTERGTWRKGERNISLCTYVSQSYIIISIYNP